MIICTWTRATRFPGLYTPGILFFFCGLQDICHFAPKHSFFKLLFCVPCAEPLLCKSRFFSLKRDGSSSSPGSVWGWGPGVHRLPDPSLSRHQGTSLSWLHGHSSAPLLVHFKPTSHHLLQHPSWLTSFLVISSLFQLPFTLASSVKFFSHFLGPPFLKFYSNITTVQSKFFQNKSHF